MAERKTTDDRRPDERDEALAVLEREPETGAASDDVEDGDTASEDSGAGSFLDRFHPPAAWPRR